MGAKHHPLLIMPTDPALLGYLAGLIDGEGNISIGQTTTAKGQLNPSCSLVVQIANCDIELMDWLLDVVGGSVRTHNHKNKTWRVGYQWQIFGANAEAFLKAIEPQLRIKRRQCEVALKFRALGGGNRSGRSVLSSELVDGREAFRQELLLLNTRGVRP